MTEAMLIDEQAIENRIQREQEVAVLLADIAKFQPRCIVCMRPVPSRRSTSRSKDTCSAECAKVVKAFRKHNIVSRMCRACLHPSTPEERADWKQWRKDRGSRRQGPGRPSPRVGQMTDAIEAAREALEILNRFRNFENSMADVFHIVIADPDKQVTTGNLDKQVTMGSLIDAALAAIGNVPNTKPKQKAPESEG